MCFVIIYYLEILGEGDETSIFRFNVEEAGLIGVLNPSGSNC